MAKTAPPPSAADAAAQERGPWFLALAGLLLFFLAWRVADNASGFWLPGLGIGIALVSWFGMRAIVVLAPILFAASRFASTAPGLAFVIADTVLHIALIASSWWLYHHIARGSQWLDDPRSVTLFLLLVPGGLSASVGLIQAFYYPRADETPLYVVAASFWLSRMVGIMVVAPFLIVACGPLLLRYRLVANELPPAFFGEREATVSRIGDWIELAGLTFVACVLGLMLLWTYAPGNAANWILWACCLILIVWTCIRQGLRGGCIAASVASGVMLGAALAAGMRDSQSAIQGFLLSFCSSGLLVGVSASWIRANEIRYRHVVSRIPFVVYSARLPEGIPSTAGQAKTDGKNVLHVGPNIARLANVMLVSPASDAILAARPDDLLGPFADWLERIEPDDRELVIASLAQLCLQRQPVTCEYRLRADLKTPAELAAPGVALPPRGAARNAHCWLRDTMTPHYGEGGLVDGWEGLVEDITDQRNLSQNLRRTSTMLQVLVSNLPMGVYFVQAPQGFPLLVNARARQLLGQREDLSAGLDMLPRVFRLHRPDGTEYPADELPVCKALRLGATCRANDIVVHRADGRKIPLIAWAAPIDLHNTGRPDAAVWVLEDLSSIHQAEMAARESETRWRVVIDAITEGIVVQTDTGAILECNAAACSILGVEHEQCLQKGWQSAGACVREDGQPLPPEEQPDRRALQTGTTIRNIVVGVQSSDRIRWLLMSSVPLPLAPAASARASKARVVTTFADITELRNAQEAVHSTHERYQTLVETLPFMLVQRDKDFNITYLNSAATQLTGHSREDMMRPAFCDSIIPPDDLPLYHAAANSIAHGKSARIEVRFRTKDGSMKNVLAFFHPNFSKGEVAGSTSLVVDITAQRRLEEELQRAKHLELVGRLASGTVHDFNNLLTVLMGLAGIARAGLEPDHPVQQHLTRIEDVGAQAAHLAGQVLAFSKHRPHQNKPIDLNATVTQTIRLAKSVLPGNIEANVILDPSVPHVIGDDVPFKQVLMNLCLNARDAMTDGGTLTIRTDRTPPPFNQNGKKWARLSIEDTGHGMSKEVRDRVFEPFFSTKEHGTGLGLAVVQRIVKEFGGHIEVWSEPGRGTRFDIWFAQA